MDNPLISTKNHGYEPQRKRWKRLASSLRDIIPSAARDCSTYKFQSQMTFRLCTSFLKFESQNKRRILYTIFPFLVLCFFVLQGCANTGKPRHEVEYYLLDYTPPTFVNKTQINTTIRIYRFTIASAYNTQNMVFRTDNYTLDFFNYNRWAINPADMTADTLLRDMQASGLFRAVFSRYTVEDSRFLLQGGISDFFLRFGKDGKTAVISMEITLKDSQQQEATKRIVFQKKYTREETLTDQSPHGYCEAMSKALKNLSQQITTDVYHAVKTAAN